ncbi:MAG: 2-methylcitrate synthase [Candidatus Endonucleobacter bathymodioli]|uniref:Citrate synthase n=1 Tax=Candidatus Endonucleibacter bathymodioli TaxID=539814 RepID=A0AA90SWI1_9GAMM|nr:2-methylcitrate synthase [Candidatus Endonucleobacter bathymodioli]
MVNTATGGAGLRGQSAGETRLCTVGQAGAGLTYCGYDIADMAENACFEEVAWLLFYGELPTANMLSAYKNKLKSLRHLPKALKRCLEEIPAVAHPMDVLRTGCSLLGSLEPERNFSHQQDIADRLLAVSPSILLYWYRYTHDVVRIETETDDDTIASHFLHMLHGKPPSSEHRRCLDVSLILYAEHEFNASTFTARVCASTLSDMHSCVTGAIGSLRGPLHGGANEAAMAMIQQYSSPAEAVEAINVMLDKKEKIMGFGHAVYRESDPRNIIIKKWSEKLSSSANNHQLYLISEAIEKTMWDKKKLFANADFFHASAYHFMDIPTKIFTPIFVCSRMSGWAAHIMEQRSNNRIIRPAADYIGAKVRKWLPLKERG